MYEIIKDALLYPEKYTCNEDEMKFTISSTKIYYQQLLLNGTPKNSYLKEEL